MVEPVMLLQSLGAGLQEVWVVPRRAGWLCWHHRAVPGSLFSCGCLSTLGVGLAVFGGGWRITASHLAWLEDRNQP